MLISILIGVILLVVLSLYGTSKRKRECMCNRHSNQEVPNRSLVVGNSTTPAEVIRVTPAIQM